MKEAIRGLIGEALRKCSANGDIELADEPDIVVEEPKEKKMGDFSTTVAMSLAKKTRKNPKILAEAICRQLGASGGDIESVETREYSDEEFDDDLVTA